MRGFLENGASNDSEVVDNVNLR